MEYGFNELREIYSKYFSLNYLGKDITNKFGLIGLICYWHHKLKVKPTFVELITFIGKDFLPEKAINGLAIICEDYSYGCTEFPNFGIPDNQIKDKVKELLQEYFPF